MNEFFKLGMLSAFEKLSRQALGKMFKGQKFSTKALASMESLPSSVVKASPKGQVAYAKRLRERAQRIKALKQQKLTEPTRVTSPAGRALFAEASGKKIAPHKTNVANTSVFAPTRISKPGAQNTSVGRVFTSSGTGKATSVSRPPKPAGSTGAVGAIFG